MALLDKQRAGLQPPSSPFTIGNQLGKYLLTDRLGQGGAGEVYLAYHKTLNIPVAIKVLRTCHGVSSPQFADQLKSEARILAQLNHPHLVRVWDYEDHPEHPFLVMEYVAGSSLAELIQQSGGMRPDRAIDLITQVAEGLAVAHRHGIVHRDIKPGNILINKDGSAKLADLGQAVMKHHDTPAGSADAQDSGFTGTPLYMPPEQCQSSGAVDVRSDIYSLGVTFYHTLTGQLPFSGISIRELMLQHAEAEAIPPHELSNEIPPTWSEVILTMMAKNPEDRYADCEELLVQLREMKVTIARPKSSRETRSLNALSTRQRESMSQEIAGGTPPRSPSPASLENPENTGVRKESSQRSRVVPRVVPGAAPVAPSTLAASKAMRPLQEGIAAAKAGKKEYARRLLLEATAFDPTNPAGWFWLASVSTSTQESINCIERVLSLDPNNQQAKQWLDKLRANQTRAANRQCPFCRTVATNSDPMCDECGAITNLQDIDLVFTAEPLMDTTSYAALAARCEAALRTKQDFQTHYLLGLTYLNMQNFDKSVEQFQAAAKLRASDANFQRQVVEMAERWNSRVRSTRAPAYAAPVANQKSVIVIDDSPTVCKLVSVILTKYGYRVSSAGSGLEGIEILRREPTGLILLDIMMNGMDGFQLCKLIRSEPSLSRIPVVFLSGKEGLFTKVRARMAGSTAYITKPFREEELVQVVEQHCLS